MDPAAYDAWYDSPRGRWIGDREFALAHRLGGLQSGGTLLDVGCGTGWFTRRFAEAGCRVTGVDTDAAALRFAQANSPASIDYRIADAARLPFEDVAFDVVVSIAALCFVADERRAVAEVVRVARQRFVVGWLNRDSLLYRQKGRSDGSYRGAHWHNAREAKALIAGLPVHDLQIRSAVFLPGGGVLARGVEAVFPSRIPLGAMLFVAGSVVR